MFRQTGEAWLVIFFSPYTQNTKLRYFMYNVYPSTTIVHYDETNSSSVYPLFGNVSHTEIVFLSDNRTAVFVRMFDGFVSSQPLRYFSTFS